MRPTEYTEEQEHRKKLLAAAAKGDVEAQKELQQEYQVRVLSPAERAQYKYAEIKPDKVLPPRHRH